MRLIDADELKKDDEVNLWLSNNAVRTGKTLKMFSELFIKKIDEQPTVEAIPKADYKTRLKADMVDTLTKLLLEIEQCGVEDSHWIIKEKINALKEEKP